MYDLVCVGSVTKDIFFLTDRGKVFKTPKDKLAPEWIGFELGEKIRADETFQRVGGVATDISVGTRKLGLRSIPFSTVGEDSDSLWAREALKNEKVGLEGLIAKANRRMPVSFILVDKKSGERVIFTERLSGDLDLSMLGRFKAKYVFAASLKGKIREQTENILSCLKDGNAQLIISPSTSQIRDSFPNLKKLMKRSKILILNKNEALEIASMAKTGTGSIQNLIKLLHKFGPETICITDGIKGAYASDGRIIAFSKAKKVKTVDVTGAGDAFASGFLGFYLRNFPLRTALKAGIINSANVTRYVGTTEGLLSASQLRHKLTSN